MLASISYVPILKTKAAEVTAYRNLADPVKDVVFPTFLARPWQNANELAFTFDKIGEAADGRPFALGLDRVRRGWASTKHAQRQFDALFDDTGGFRAYYGTVASVEGAVPIMTPSQSADNLLLQLGHATELDRGLVIHVTQENWIPVLNLASTVPPLPHDTIFVVDAGWSRNYELLEAWTSTVVGRIVSVLPDVEIVIACSSFPDSFSDIVGEATKIALERRLFMAIRQRFNQADLTFGDWGSTRLAQSGGGGAIPPRIDIPRTGGWAIYRADPDGAQSYRDMALAAMVGDAFATMPECFGKQMVRETPQDGTITGPAKSTTARINMHLTLHSDAKITLDGDDTEYVD